MAAYCSISDAIKGALPAKVNKSYDLLQKIVSPDSKLFCEYLNDTQQIINRYNPSKKPLGCNGFCFTFFKHWINHDVGFSLFLL
jgi:hypothetical protein